MYYANCFKKKQNKTVFVQKIQNAYLTQQIEKNPVKPFQDCFFFF